MSRPARPDTIAVRTGIGTDRHHGAVVPPLHLSSTFTFADLGEPREYDYTRSGNPTRDQFADAIARLEAGQGGVVTSSGMSAVGLVLRLLSRGDVLLAPHDCYGGCHRLFAAEADRVGFDVVHADQAETSTFELARQIRPAIIWLETPSNPFLRVVDIAAWADVARATGSFLVVDNTFLSPVLQQPLGLGADIVVHSATKFLNGHSDIVAGAVVARESDVHERLAWWANASGVTGSPFDAYLGLRGVRTIAARQAVHERNALGVVAALQDHPAVASVYHPSLPDHPGHDIAARQQRGWGSLVSFELHGGVAAVRAFVTSLAHFSLAESLGGVESLVAHPETMTHASMTPEARAAAGITDRLVRLSVGIEAEADLVADLVQALSAAEEGACVAI